MQDSNQQDADQSTPSTSSTTTDPVVTPSDTSSIPPYPPTPPTSESVAPSMNYSAAPPPVTEPSSTVDMSSTQPPPPTTTEPPPPPSEVAGVPPPPEEKKDRRKLWLILATLFIAVTIPLAVYLAQQTQEIRQRAQVYPMPSPSFRPPPPGGAFICSWHRDGSNPYYPICEDPLSGNGNDGIGQMRTSSTKALIFCQELQNDRDYDPNSNCGPTQGTKIIRWTAMGPRGTTCEYTCNFCEVVNGGEPTCTHSGDCSNDELVPPANDNWNFNECAKCTSGQADVTWNPMGSVTINSITGRNYRPQMQPLDTDGDGTPDDTQVRLPESKLDFRIEIFEQGNTTPLRTAVIPHPDSHINCIYPTADTYSLRDNAFHYLDCTLSDYTISGLTFIPGRTYTLKTWVRRGYITDESGWVDYVADAQGNLNRNICNNSFTMPVVPPSPSPTPLVTPTPQPTPAPFCADIRVYQVTGNITDSANWTRLTQAQMNALQPGNTIYISIVGGSQNAPIQFDRGRIRVNIDSTAGTFIETATIKPKPNPTDPDEFYISYTIPANLPQTATFKPQGEVCVLSGNACSWY